MYPQVIVYNSGAGRARPDQRARYALRRVPLQHAIGMLFRGVARELEWLDGEYIGPYRKVTAVELINEVATLLVYRSTRKVMFSKQNVLRRDRYRCAYCGKTGDTVDHVTPKARGGRSAWLNCVAACQPCNGRKADRTPEQAGMRLDVDPWVPTLADLGMHTIGMPL